MWRRARRGTRAAAMAPPLLPIGPREAPGGCAARQRLQGQPLGRNGSGTPAHYRIRVTSTTIKLRAKTTGWSASGPQIRWQPVPIALQHSRYSVAGLAASAPAGAATDVAAGGASALGAPCGGGTFIIAPVIGMKNTPMSRREWILPSASLV